jgi:hypothetical protein
VSSHMVAAASLNDDGVARRSEDPTEQGTGNGTPGCTTLGTRRPRFGAQGVISGRHGDHGLVWFATEGCGPKHFSRQAIEEAVHRLAPIHRCPYAKSGTFEWGQAKIRCKCAFVYASPNVKDATMLPICLLMMISSDLVNCLGLNCRSPVQSLFLNRRAIVLLWTKRPANN